MNGHPAFRRLCDDDKDTFRFFITRSHDNETRESILLKMIDLIRLEPDLSKVNVSDVVDQPFLPYCHGQINRRLFPSHVLLLSYGRPDTETEAELTLQLLILTYTYMKHIRKQAKVDLGVDWVPQTGWAPLEIALLRGCDSRLIEFLSLKEARRRKSEALLAAVLGKQVEFAKSAAKINTDAATLKICLRERLNSRSHRRSVLDLLLTMPEDDDRNMEVLKFFLNTLPSPICFERDSHISDTVRKTDTLLTCLSNRKLEALKMKSVSWSFDSFQRLLSNLESNKYIRTLHLRVPDPLVVEEPIYTGLIGMFRQMESLTYFEMDLEEDSWLNNQLTFNALAEAFPQCNVRSVAFNGCMRFTHESQSLSGLYGSAELETVLNNIQQVRFGTKSDFVGGHEFIELVGKAVRDSPTLDRIIIVHDQLHPVAEVGTMPPVAHLPRCCGVNLDVLNYGGQATVLDNLAAVFERYDALINELSLESANRSGSADRQLTGTTKLSARSNVVNLRIGNCDSRVDNIFTAIISTRNLVELSLGVVRHGSCAKMSDEARQEVFTAVTESIVNGTLTKLTLPLTFVRGKSEELAALWTTLSKLELVCCPCRFRCHEKDYWSPSSARAGSTASVTELGNDLIKLAERSNSLYELVTELDLNEEHASVLRHHTVCNYAQAHLVQDVSNASVATVLSILDRINDSSWMKLYRFTRQDDKEHRNLMGPNSESARVSAAFEVMLQSSGIIASWCKDNHWRWKEQHELDFALSYLFDFDTKEQPRETKRRRCGSA